MKRTLLCAGSLLALCACNPTVQDLGGGGGATGASTTSGSGTGTKTTSTSTSTGTTTSTSTTSSSGMAPSSCTDGIEDGQETDVDCGGPVCPPCQDGQRCVVNGDCVNELCELDFCDTGSLSPDAGATCHDGIKDGQETDVDCGGPTCDSCPVGNRCLVDTDCITDVCSAGVCH